jgi:hypothetical protein
MRDFNTDMKGERTMIIISSITFPTESSKDIGQKFGGLPALPDYLTMTGPYLRGSALQGIQAITFFEVDASKMADALIALGDRYANYIGVPGYKYSINVWYDVTEALAMIGLA